MWKYEVKEVKVGTDGRTPDGRTPDAGRTDKTIPIAPRTFSRVGLIILHTSHPSEHFLPFQGVVASTEISYLN